MISKKTASDIGLGILAGTAAGAVIGDIQIHKGNIPDPTYDQTAEVVAAKAVEAEPGSDQFTPVHVNVDFQKALADERVKRVQAAAEVEQTNDKNDHFLRDMGLGAAAGAGIAAAGTAAAALLKRRNEEKESKAIV